MRFVVKKEADKPHWDELSGPEGQSVRAAEGWLDFGLISEAAEELSAIKAASAANPVILKMFLRFWCQTWFQLHAWEDLLCAARATIIAAPESHVANQTVSDALSNIARLDDTLKLLVAASDFPPSFKELFGELESHAARLRNRGSRKLNSTHPIPSDPSTSPRST